MADFELTGGHFVLPPELTSFGALASFVRPTMYEVGYLVQAAMADYPPKPPGTKYIRTGLLGKAWTVVVIQTASEIRTEIGNRTIYAPWVQSYQFQARQNRHWQTDKDIIETLEGDIVAMLEAKINSLSI